MITLLRNKNDKSADAVEEKFSDLVLAYRVVINNEIKNFIVKDGEDQYMPGKDFDNWLQQIELELKTQRSLSGDGCYIDPQTGMVC